MPRLASFSRPGERTATLLLIRQCFRRPQILLRYIRNNRRTKTAQPLTAQYTALLSHGMDWCTCVTAAITAFRYLIARASFSVNLSSIQQHVAMDQRGRLRSLRIRISDTLFTRMARTVSCAWLSASQALL